MTNARLLLDQDSSPALTWVIQRNPWVPNVIASFLRVEGISAGLFMSVTNPWGSVDISGKQDACLTFQNRCYATQLLTSIFSRICLNISPFNDLPNMPVTVPNAGACQSLCTANSNCSAYVVLLYTMHSYHDCCHSLHEHDLVYSPAQVQSADCGPQNYCWLKDNNVQQPVNSIACNCFASKPFKSNVGITGARAHY
jgi:hypothetical protein